jgi:prepilin-type N-terminal cleavage/methylation domain-containing protein
MTLLELMIVVAIIGILVAAGVLYYRSSINTARAITAKHELAGFVKFQESLFLDSGAMSQAAYTPSQDVTITAVSGDETDPFNPSDPLVVQARHDNFQKVFEYNFLTRETVEK